MHANILQAAAQALDGRAGGFLHVDGRAAQVQPAGLQAGHVQQVAHQAVEVIGFAPAGVDQFQARVAVQAGRVGGGVFGLAQAAERAGDGGQRGAQVVRDGIEQRGLQFLGFLRQARAVDLLGQQGALDSQRRQPGIGLQQLALLGAQVTVAFDGAHGQHAHHALPGHQRLKADGQVGQRFGAAPGRQAALEGPGGGLEHRRGGLKARAGGAQAQRAAFGQQNGRLAAEGLPHLLDDRLHDGRQVELDGQVAAERVQRGGLRLAPPAGFHLVAHGAGQPRNHRSYQEQRQEGEHVLGILHA